MTILKRVEVLGLARPSSPPAGIGSVGSRATWRSLAADAATAGLGAAALVHAGWATGMSWPGENRDALADLVVGVRPFPSAPLTLGVVGLIGLGIGLVRHESKEVEGRGLRQLDSNVETPPMTLPEPLVSRLLRWSAWAVPAVLAARGVGGLVVSALEIGPAADVFRHWDLRFYSPLCLVLAAAAFVAVRPLAPRTGRLERWKTMQ